MSHLRDNKFIISCSARSGSTMLVHLLRSHPQLLCHGEVFEPSRIGQLDGSYGLRRRNDPTMDQRLMEYWATRPEAFLYDVVFDTQGRRAVGFKFKTDEAFDPAYETIAGLIRDDKDIKVLHLRRKNLLDQYISHQVVLRQTGVTLVTDDSQRPEINRFEVDIDDAVSYATGIVQRERQAGAMYSGHRQAVVDYEDLVQHGNLIRERMQTFLAVPQLPLSTPTRKIIARNADLVENLEDVRAEMIRRGLGNRCPAAEEALPPTRGNWWRRWWSRPVPAE